FPAAKQRSRCLHTALIGAPPPPFLDSVHHNHWTSLSFLLASGIPIHRSGDLYRLCIGSFRNRIADQLFDKIPHSMAAKALFKWSKKLTTSQVQQLIRAEKDVQKALRIFDLATAEYSNGYKHDHSTFHIMISKLLSVNQFKPDNGSVR
ncbi:hypothetical protein LINPERPRIM_LOCUS17567, partial [Linum perenne]